MALSHVSYRSYLNGVDVEILVSIHPIPFISSWLLNPRPTVVDLRSLAAVWQAKRDRGYVESLTWSYMILENMYNLYISQVQFVQEAPL